MAGDKEGECHCQKCFWVNGEDFLLGGRGEEGKERVEVKKKEVGVCTGSDKKQKSGGW